MELETVRNSHGHIFTHSFSLVSNPKVKKKKHNVTLCHTLYPIAIEARSAVAAVSTGVVLAVSKLGALISIVRTCSKVV